MFNEMMTDEIMADERPSKTELERKIREVLFISLNAVREDLQERTRYESYNAALDLLNNAATDEATATDLYVDMEPVVSEVIDAMFEDGIDKVLTEVFDGAFEKARTIAASISTTTAAEIAFDQALEDELANATGEDRDIDLDAFNQNEFDY